jgi:hypothetical protein
MLQINDLSKHIESTLNNNLNGFTFKLHTDTGEYEAARRSVIDYNDVTQIINGISTLTSVENSPTNDGSVISSMVMRCEFVIPMRDTEEDVYQQYVDGSNELVKTGNVNYIASLRSMLDNFAQNQIFTTLEDSDKNSYTITAAFSYAESGTRAQRSRLGDSFTYVVYGYYNIIENGENSRDYVFVLDGQLIPYRSVTIGRRPISEADVYATTPYGVATSTSTASQLYLSLEVPAFISKFNNSVKNYVFEGESNTVHLLSVKAGKDLIKSYLVMFGDTSYNASGILNVGGTVSLVEAVNDYELLELGSQLNLFEVESQSDIKITWDKAGRNTVWLPDKGLYYTEEISLTIDSIQGVVVYTGQATVEVV